LFEELEQRIVLDASVDSSIHDSLHSSSDSPNNWNLAYSSDPSISLDHVLDTADLAAYHGDLASPYPSITLGVVPPTNGASVVDLSGVVRINGSPTVDSMFCAITYNPRPGTSNGVNSLSFSETTAQDITITPPEEGDDVLSRTWLFEGRYDSINAILSTMQAQMSSSFSGNAEIDITLTDSDHENDATAAPLVTRTLYISVSSSADDTTADEAPIGPSVSGPDSIDVNQGQGAAGVFGDISVSDLRARVVDVGIAVYQGTIGGTAAIPGVQVIQDVPANSLAVPPGATAGNAWVPSWLYVRGSVNAINTYLDNLTYQALATGGEGDTTADDLLTISVDDRGTNGNPPWSGNPIDRVSTLSVPIYYT
jgi:hypothetical protein